MDKYQFVNQSRAANDNYFLFINPTTNSSIILKVIYFNFLINLQLIYLQLTFNVMVLIFNYFIQSFSLNKQYLNILF